MQAAAEMGKRRVHVSKKFPVDLHIVKSEGVTNSLSGAHSESYTARGFDSAENPCGLGTGRNRRFRNKGAQNKHRQGEGVDTWQEGLNCTPDPQHVDPQPVIPQ